MPMRASIHRPLGDSDVDRKRRIVNANKVFDRSRYSTDPCYRFYLTKDWKAFRKRILGVSNICVSCGMPGNQVDHIIPIRERWDLRFAKSNLQVLCHSCHSRKTAMTTIAGHNRK